MDSHDGNLTRPWHILDRRVPGPDRQIQNVLGNPPHTDAAGRPGAVASAASSLVAKVADKMRHHFVGLGLGEVVIEMEGVHISTSKPRAQPAADLR